MLQQLTHSLKVFQNFTSILNLLFKSQICFILSILHRSHSRLVYYFFFGVYLPLETIIKSFHPANHNFQKTKKLLSAIALSPTFFQSIQRVQMKTYTTFWKITVHRLHTCDLTITGWVGTLNTPDSLACVQSLLSIESCVTKQHNKLQRPGLCCNAAASMIDWS